MQIKDGLEWTFDTVTAAYEKLRPGYVEELYQTIFDYIPIDSHSSVVEIGSGGGQATAPILKTGCSLTTVEYSKLFSEHLKHITDEKPITARQCVNALAQVGLVRPQYIPQILSALHSADLSKYKDSMRPLIERDMEETEKILTNSSLQGSR